MNIVLSRETQELIEKRMKELDIPNSDDLVQLALMNFTEPEVCDYDELDAPTKAAIEEAEQQLDRGDSRPWEDVRAELFSKFEKK